MRCISRGTWIMSKTYDLLFIQGQKTYLIEYGAGFFVERNAKEAIDFYSRKIDLVKKKSSKLQEIIE